MTLSATPRFCLPCDDGTQLVQQTKDMAITLEGHSMVVAQVTGWHCPVCTDCEFKAGEGQRHSEALSTLRQAVNKDAALQLRAMRKRLGLRQAEAGRLFGGGTSAFSEYERGKTQPHKSTLLLLKLLDKHPELLPEVIAA